VSWEDRILSFHLSLALFTLSVLLFFLVQLLAMIPWGLIWEWTLRSAGLAALGPHMYIVGRRYRADAREELRKAREFASGSKAQRREILEKLRRQLYDEAVGKLEAQTIQAEGTQQPEGTRATATCGLCRWLWCQCVGGGSRNQEAEGPAPSQRYTEGGVQKSSHTGCYHLIVQPRPTAGKLRTRFVPDRLRSYAYPLHPAEDRPPTAHDGGFQA